MDTMLSYQFPNRRNVLIQNTYPNGGKYGTYK